MAARRFAALLAAVLVVAPSAVSATIQENDTLIFGGRRYKILQSPMLGLWHHDERQATPGTVLAPPFEVTSSANWKGYRATWEIADSELLLRKIIGRIDGKRVKNEEILTKPRRRFPRFADWYTGRIYLPVGDYDQDKNEFAAVILFEIERGRVTKMTFLESAPPVWTWNGLEESPVDEEASEPQPSESGSREPRDQGQPLPDGRGSDGSDDAR